MAILAAITIGALPAFAQTPAPQPAAAAQDPQCTPENKLAWYNEFRKLFKTDTAKADELAKKWLACPQVAGEEQITPYLKNFVALYEKASRKDRVTDLVFNKKDYPKAFEIGKAVLVDEPDNLRVILDLAYAGFAAAAAKNDAYNADAVNYAKKAMQLIEAGKAPENWSPYSGAPEAQAYLNNIIGQLTVQKNPTEALPYLLKVGNFESKLKKLPSTYGTIAAAYEAGPYAKQSEDYKRIYSGKDETPESKLALENINQIIDRMIDAYARAVALTGTDAAYAAAKKEWTDSLSTWYKFRHAGTEDGLPEMIAGILTKPLPPFPTPITTLPAATPSSSPTSGAVNAAGSSPENKVPTGTAPATQPAASTTTPKTPTTPAATPKPSPSPSPKPRIKRNHRSH